MWIPYSVRRMACGHAVLRYEGGRAGEVPAGEPMHRHSGPADASMSQRAVAVHSDGPSRWTSAPRGAGSNRARPHGGKHRSDNRARFPDARTIWCPVCTRSDTRPRPAETRARFGVANAQNRAIVVPCALVARSVLRPARPSRHGSTTHPRNGRRLPDRCFVQAVSADTDRTHSQ